MIKRFSSVCLRRRPYRPASPRSYPVLFTFKTHPSSTTKSISRCKMPRIPIIRTFRPEAHRKLLEMNRDKEQYSLPKQHNVRMPRPSSLEALSQFKGEIDAQRRPAMNKGDHHRSRHRRLRVPQVKQDPRIKQTSPPPAVRISDA